MDKILKYLSPSEREGLENLVSLTFVILAFLYVAVFLGDFYTYVKTAALKSFPELSYLELVLKYGLVIVVPVIYTRFFLFAHDSLAYGSDKYARFFRATLPSAYLREALRVEQSKANELWFKIFNVWRNRNHPRNPQWYATFRRTYSCRFIYHLQRWLFRATALFAVTLILDAAYKGYKAQTLVVEDIVFARAILTVTMLVLAIVLAAKNRVRRELTGCWARLKEIEGGHMAWLEQEVVRPAGGDFDRAWELATSWEIKWGATQAAPSAPTQ
jgi:hypothetical protein